MTHFFRPPARKPAGAAPGTLIHVGERKMAATRISLIDYDAGRLTERDVEDVGELLPLKDSSSTSWIDVVGLHDIGQIETIGKHFGIHPLVQEDILNTRQRPKVDAYEDYLHICIKMITFDAESGHLAPEQISLIIGNHHLITFQEMIGDSFEPVRERLRRGAPRIREGGTSYLAYALMDAVVDHYFVALDQIGGEIADLEEALLAAPTTDTLETLHRLKREMLYYRKLVWPVRELLGRLVREDHALISDKTIVYLNDVYDHTIQVIDTIESYRDMLSGMMDLYLSTVSNRMNEVMKVLTLIATIFIPLTFLAGIYGMNFKVMPELEWPWAYFALWGLMIAIAAVLLMLFKRKHWL